MKLLTLALISFLLISCTSQTVLPTVAEAQTLAQQKNDKIENKENDKPINCSRIIDGIVQYVEKPVVTGLDRSKTVQLIENDRFFQRLEDSALWKKLSDTSEIYLDKNFTFFDINAYVKTRSNQTHILKISYKHLDPSKQKLYGHQLLDADKLGMTETINIIIDDKQKSSEILDQLYQQYMEKVNNNDLLSDGETIHTYVEYNGILFELWGGNRTKHLKPECNFSMLSSLTIS